MSSHVWSIISAEVWWNEIYSIMLFSSIIPSLVLTLDCVYVTFFKVPSVLNELSFWRLIQGRFVFPITLSLFDVLKLFYLLLLTYKLKVIHLLLLDLYETFLYCFLLDEVKTITIYFNFVKYCLSIIKIKLENLEDVQCHEHWSLIDRVINIMIDSIVFGK